MKKNKKLFFLTSTLIATSVVMPAMVISCGNSKGSELWQKSGITQTVVGQGSSSVAPIINGLQSESEGNLQYNITGSGKGVSSMDKATPDQGFGMTSSTKTPSGKTWVYPNLRTLTWAIDAIAIAIHLPDGLSATGGKPIVDIEQLRKAYYGEKVLWKDLVTNLSDKTSIAEVFVFGREGGKGASGTADGFMHTLLHGVTLPAGVKKDEVENHDKLTAEHLTQEANSLALKSVKDKPGSLTYLSLGYALKHEEGGVQVANIKNGADTWVPTIDNVSNGTYKWTRPFNIIYDTKNDDAVKFAKFLLSEDIQKYVTKKDFVQLTQDQIKIQIANDTDYTKNDHQMWEVLHGDVAKAAKFAQNPKATNDAEKLFLGLLI